MRGSFLSNCRQLALKRWRGREAAFLGSEGPLEAGPEARRGAFCQPAQAVWVHLISEGEIGPC